MSVLLPIAGLAVAMFVVLAASARKEAPAHLGCTTPVHQAGRILAHRYASGQITSDEYARMIEVLRHKR